ncbi:hypothetical protein BN2497_7487 [Janthinobacterium sp. CG23_2]|nr:hypothetical protein BN2497_7487 [Janthinobacterium sp. CG23_2]CUU30141.1 hypothetical protein BN3177_7487 [Janthinobacterium sp. CG23_2]
MINLFLFRMKSAHASLRLAGTRWVDRARQHLPSTQQRA